MSPSLKQAITARPQERSRVGIGEEDRAHLYGWNGALYRARTITVVTDAGASILPPAPAGTLGDADMKG
jgi:hypothetical protein